MLSKCSGVRYLRNTRVWSRQVLGNIDPDTIVFCNHVCYAQCLHPCLWYLGPLWNTGEGEENRRNGKTQERKASSIPLESLRRCCGYSFLPWAPTECYVSCGYSETTLVPLEWFLCFSSAFQRHADVSTGIFSYSFNCPVIQRGPKISRVQTKQGQAKGRHKLKKNRKA